MKLDAKKVEKISKALGDPYRLKIIDLIKKEKDWCPCSSIAGNIDLAQSTISHHIKQLIDAELVIAEKDGRNALYHINKELFDEYVKYLNHFRE